MDVKRMTLDERLNVLKHAIAVVRGSYPSREFPPEDEWFGFEAYSHMWDANLWLDNDEKYRLDVYPISGNRTVTETIVVSADFKEALI